MKVRSNGLGFFDLADRESAESGVLARANVWARERALARCYDGTRDYSNAHSRLYRLALTQCYNCRMLAMDHVRGKCLYSPTTFET
jgi:hypothetical protein